MTAAFRPAELTLAAARRSERVVIVGTGAIGGSLADDVARIPALRSAMLVDPDRVEARNVLSQHVVLTDVHHPKVTVHRRRMRRINPQLIVEAWRMPVQRVPLGALRNAVILSAPDNREVRRYLGEVAWCLGAVLIDSGVEPSGWLARVTGYLPGADNACPQCQFSEAEYQQLTQRYLCDNGATPPAPTNAPAALGSIAAALQALELHKLLAGAHDQLLIDRQVVIDLMHHRHFVTKLRRNPACRFSHEPPWQIVDLATAPDELTIDQLFAVACPDAAAPTLRVPGTDFIARLTCRLCGAQRTLLRLANRLRPAEARCRACGGELLATGMDVRARLGAADMPPALRAQALGSLGLEAGDIIAIEDGDRAHHVQLGRLASRSLQQEGAHAGSNP